MQEEQQMILHELISYDVLRLIWWLLLGVLLVGFADRRFDLGAWGCARHGQDRCGAPHRHQRRRPRVGRQPGVADSGRRRHLCRLAQLYAVSFSGFYLAMFAVLVPLILRPWRSSSAASMSAAWRNRWDWVLCITGLVPALLFGVAVGNVISACHFAWVTICAFTTTAASSACSRLSRCCAVWSRCPCCSCMVRPG
jgi:cytochrome d ubiquinol oxidase subunit II